MPQQPEPWRGLRPAWAGDPSHDLVRRRADDVSADGRPSGFALSGLYRMTIGARAGAVENPRHPNPDTAR